MSDEESDMNVTIDPAAEISANKWESTKVFRTYGSNDLHGVIAAMILDRRPGTKLEFSAYRGPRLTEREFWVGVLADSDPWRDIQDIAGLMAMHLFFDGDTCYMGYAVA